ncbi:metallophosphoesterase [Methylobacterium indicum]|uniref:Metallophosphoesterase n=1 Tax=Methylobacterium indicum TaxID=1775910 RepID=A0A8H8X0D7_9HYPH|nr:metallophosphoesterase [Methylobacterium indicum]BCM87780.1 metallophosphoesterase [Methylobacterium indicum]
MTVFFTSDTHDGHKNIISSCDRPFSSVEEMHRVMVARWNETVGPRDVVYHLGDVGWDQTPAEFLKLIDSLNGDKHLILGNHDPDFVRNLAGCAAYGFRSIQERLEIRLEGERIVLDHYPMRSWNASYHGSFHFFGHCHNRMPPIHRSLDVGVDAWDFRPVTFTQIRQRLDKLGLLNREKAA